MSFWKSDEKGDRRHILVADNDLIVRSVLRSLFTKIGQTVDHVASGDEALTLALKKRFDLVILDIDMPPDGGLHVCRSLRGEAAYAETPIVMLTGLDTADARARSQYAGASLFIAKPFNPAELMRLLAPYLQVADTDRGQLAEILNADRGLRVQDATAAQTATRNR